MIRRRMFCLALAALAGAAGAQPAPGPDRATYKSPYSVEFTFSEEELIGDLLRGARSDWKNQSDTPFKQWYDKANQTRWGFRGPSARHYDAPSGLGSRPVEWTRQRVIAAGLRLAGYSYQHHHIPDWEPPAEWPRNPDQKTPVGKGLDCSNFTAFVYNWALGIKPTGDVRKQAELTEMPGPGPRRSFPVRRIEIPAEFDEFEERLLTGDLLFVKNSRGELSHVVLWVGKIGRSPDGSPLILDSTGVGAVDSNGNQIPDGVYLRPFRPTNWYFRQASHVLRVIPDGQ
jgi:hypothetical protein